MPDYDRLCRAIGGERLPTALVDLDMLDANIDHLFGIVRASGKTLRLATKSVRCPDAIDYIVARGGDAARGLMAYAVSEAAFLVEERGYTDILVAYPSVQPADVALLADLNARADTAVSIIVDAEDQLARLAHHGGAADIPVVVEVDMSLRALGGRVHLGVRRSPLHTAADVVRVAQRALDTPGVTFAGVMGYEAQIAGLGEANPYARAMNPVKALIKRASAPVVRERRQQVADALDTAGIPCPLFNGGGTGSLAATGSEAAITEVTAGSGFFCSHLFDYYPGTALRPAAYFALQVVRHPEPGAVTCHGGGYIASGAAGADRLPRPALPHGLELTSLEGAGEVQTPLTGPGTAALAPGDPVFFRHAKAGELAEHFNEYLFVRGDAIAQRAKTYRGFGHAFL